VKTKRGDSIRTAVFWGSLWGLWEATAGHLVHLARVPGLPGLVMLPAALFFMSRAFIRSGRAETIFLTGCVAAALKLSDLLIPGLASRAALNPALAILAEALAVTGLYAFFKAKSPIRAESRNATPRPTK
jgi:hypothetical protein